MLDLTGIMFSSIMMLIAIVRAVVLDRSQPWFQTADQRKAATERRQAPPTRAWRRARGS